MTDPIGFIITAIIAGVIFLTPIALIALWFWALFYFGRLIFRSLRGRSQVDPLANVTALAHFAEASASGAMNHATRSAVPVALTGLRMPPTSQKSPIF